MKKLLLSLLLAAVAVNSRAQGTFNFDNDIGGVFAPVTQASGGAYIGMDYTASLFWAVGTIVDPSQLNLLAPADTTFFGTTGTGSPGTDGAGTFGLDGLIMPVASGTTITVQVRAWQTTAGSYAGALAGGGAYQYGASNLVPLQLGTSMSVPSLVGLTPFRVNVPEPATIFLGGFGAASLLLFRRRK